MTVAEITPVGQDLVTEVSIEAQHIDRVHTGQLRSVKFTSFKSRTSPVLPGTLGSLSPTIANSIPTDAERKKGGKPCYTGAIKMHQEESYKFLTPRNVKLIPDMAADVEKLKNKQKK